MLKTFLRGAALLAVMAASSAQARDVAYLIGNSTYDHYDDVSTAGRVGDMAKKLEDAGFEVTLAEDMTAERLGILGNSILRDARGADTFLVFVSGHVVSGPTDAWLLGRDARSVNAVTAGQQGLSLNALSAIGARIPGRALLLVADNREEPDLGYAMNDGLDGLHLPQGVTLVRGPYFKMQQLVRTGLLEPDQTLAGMIEASDGELRAEGYVSNLPLFRSSGIEAPLLNKASLIETGFWQAVQDIGTEGAYEAYIGRYPDGAHAGQARQRLAALVPDDPIKLAEAAEAALGLDRDARRAVQRDLDILGFDPRGIDGIFGPGTRAAIRGWQDANDFVASGYLDRAQRVVLRQSARARAEELQREAEARRKRVEAEDRAYWRQVSSSETADGYRQYLERYPDGQFAEQATRRLDAIERSLRAKAAREERDAWDRAREGHTVAAYERYLSRFPRGDFADTARQRIAGLKQELEQSDRLRAAEAEERAVISGGAMALIAETRLAQLGYEPGTVDGAFDQSTRRAIRQYQRAVNEEVTGYIGKRTLVLLLSGRN